MSANCLSVLLMLMIMMMTVDSESENEGLMMITGSDSWETGWCPFIQCLSLSLIHSLLPSLRQVTQLEDGDWSPSRDCQFSSVFPVRSKHSRYFRYCCLCICLWLSLLFLVSSWCLGEILWVHLAASPLSVRDGKRESENVHSLPVQCVQRFSLLGYYDWWMSFDGLREMPVHSRDRTSKGERRGEKHKWQEKGVIYWTTFSFSWQWKGREGSLRDRRRIEQFREKAKDRGERSFWRRTTGIAQMPLTLLTSHVRVDKSVSDCYMSVSQMSILWRKARGNYASGFLVSS